MLLFDGITLPLEDPILKFLLILVIILAAPLLLNKLKIPYLLGLIIAGAVIGPHGLNLVLRDSSIILSGTAGLLYIMFLSGLDMDMSDFRKNGTRSLVFGLYTFCVPLLLGILAGYYILGFSIYSSILLAGLFASQTLIAYPIVSKLGIARDKAVTIAVGGTVITDTLALLLLTVIVGMVTGNTDDMFWYRLGISVVLCIAFIMQLFPLIGHWFFKHCSDNISQYIFVLVMVFLGAYLAHLAGLEPIIAPSSRGWPSTASSRRHLAPDEPHRIRRQRHLHPLLPDRRRHADRLPGLLPRLGEHQGRRRDDRPDHRRQIHRRAAHSKTSNSPATKGRSSSA